MLSTLRRLVFYSGFMAGVVSAGLLVGVCQPATAYAQSQSRLQLVITPTVCVVDVVQDGSGQQLQTTADMCDSLLPNLVTPLLQTAAETGPFPLPFAGRPAAEIPVPPPAVRQTAWWPITSADPGVSTVRQQNVRFASVMAAGVTAVVLVTGISIDLVLFELRYSRIAGRWLRARLPHLHRK